MAQTLAAVNDPVEYLLIKWQTLPPSKRLLVGISGIPASGKSTLARLLVDQLNSTLRARAVPPSPNEGTPPNAVLVGLDGWHLTRSQLDCFPDPQLAHDRRGIHWTFDAPAYVDFVRLLRQDVTPSTAIITAPSFDHALKDPTPEAVTIYPSDCIVVIEGLYTFLSIEPWSQAGLLLDERWLLKVDSELAHHRLVNRHVLTGVTKNMDEAVWRAETNDTPNGRFILANLLEPTRTVESVGDLMVLASGDDVHNDES